MGPDGTRAGPRPGRQNPAGLDAGFFGGRLPPGPGGSRGTAARAGRLPGRQRAWSPPRRERAAAAPGKRGTGACPGFTRQSPCNGREALATTCTVADLYLGGVRSFTYLGAGIRTKGHRHFPAAGGRRGQSKARGLPGTRAPRVPGRPRSRRQGGPGREKGTPVHGRRGVEQVPCQDQRRVIVVAKRGPQDRDPGGPPRHTVRRGLAGMGRPGRRDTLAARGETDGTDTPDILAKTPGAFPQHSVKNAGERPRASGARNVNDGRPSRRPSWQRRGSGQARPSRRRPFRASVGRPRPASGQP